MISEVQNKTGKILIRTDASVQIGTGHVMRCIALAQAWQDQGGDVTFLCNCESEALRQRIIDEGFDFIAIEKPHPHPSDLHSTLEVLSAISHQPSPASLWLALDGYHFTPDYQKAIRENGYKLLVIDDMAHLDHYHADILLNQNINASSLHYPCDRNTVKLLGSEYVLFRREFLKYKNLKRGIPDKAKNILVTMGGADPENMTLKIIRALNRLSDSDLEIKIIVGPANPNRNTLKKEIRHLSCTFHLSSSVCNSMPELLKWADLSVICAGGTLWECLFMGCPLISFSGNKAHYSVLQSLHEQGIVQHIGYFLNSECDRISESIRHVSTAPDSRRNMIRKGRKIIDGNGVSKTIYIMFNEGGCYE
jgi:UDP-2,4-diacetamido-2,4,6-trideoxy-beta-L-altropyranose hydrolase